MRNPLERAVNSTHRPSNPIARPQSAAHSTPPAEDLTPSVCQVSGCLIARMVPSERDARDGSNLSMYGNLAQVPLGNKCSVVGSARNRQLPLPQYVVSAVLLLPYAAAPMSFTSE